MLEVSWSRCGGGDCIRLAGVAPRSVVRVRPATAVALGTAPPTAGRVVRDGDDVCFLPRFPFLDGTAYTVTVDGVVAAELTRPRPDRPATTEVFAVYPSAPTVPRNLLRCYLWFTAPMSEGYAADHVRLVDDAGDVMAGALLPTEHELWDAGRRRLTLLLDPARIKRGLAPHRQVGYPLRTGAAFRLVVDDRFRDARGCRLRAGAERRYQVAEDERRRVDPHTWALGRPRASTLEPLVVEFGRPLDHGLLDRCLRVVGPDGRPVEGAAAIGPEQRSWRLAPRLPWPPGPHRLVVDPVLEDLAGNSVHRVFDRDLARRADEPGAALPVELTFRPLDPGPRADSPG